RRRKRSSSTRRREASVVRGQLSVVSCALLSSRRTTNHWPRTMTKESRYNLIFLAVLLALMLPGAVILFRKKLEPTLRPMSEPDPVPRTIAYVSNGTVPPGMRRVEPPHLAEWVDQVARE